VPAQGKARSPACEFLLGRAGEELCGGVAGRGIPLVGTTGFPTEIFDQPNSRRNLPLSRSRMSVWHILWHNMGHSASGFLARGAGVPSVELSRRLKPSSMPRQMQAVRCAHQPSGILISRMATRLRQFCAPSRSFLLHLPTPESSHSFNRASTAGLRPNFEKSGNCGAIHNFYNSTTNSTISNERTNLLENALSALRKYCSRVYARSPNSSLPWPRCYLRSLRLGA
jgi:hypothetical protein